MKVSDLLADLETGDRTLEHLKDVPPTQGSISQFNQLGQQIDQNIYRAFRGQQLALGGLQNANRS